MGRPVEKHRAGAGMQMETTRSGRTGCANGGVRAEEDCGGEISPIERNAGREKLTSRNTSSVTAARVIAARGSRPRDLRWRYWTLVGVGDVVSGERCGWRDL